MSETAPRGNLVIYGAGDHGLVVAEAAVLAGWAVVGFVDDQVLPGTTIGEWPVLAETLDEPTIVAVGENRTRHRIIARLVEAGVELASVIHPSAAVSLSAQVGDGAYIGPLAVVNAEAMVGLGAIVNSHATVEHHGHLHRCAHVGPNAALCGRVAVGERTLIGAGSSVLPGITIGRDATVGAGSVVRVDVADGQTVVGNPATPIR